MVIDQLTAVFLVALAFSAGMLLWTYTPSGKRWLKSMNPPDEDGE